MDIVVSSGIDAAVWSVDGKGTIVLRIMWKREWKKRKKKKREWNLAREIIIINIFPLFFFFCVPVRIAIRRCACVCVCWYYSVNEVTDYSLTIRRIMVWRDIHSDI